jgi:DNA polymerase-4
MDYQIREFNPKSSTIMHIDLNSCFATIEQQANPYLRGKAIAVAAYTTPSGCIVAPSIEAKELGIKVGMRVKDGKLIYPNLIVLPPDPDKYRNVHLALRKLFSSYTFDFSPKSIDEFVLQMSGYPSLKEKTMYQIGQEIKIRIKKEIGEWLTVSIGIAPNRYLAKVASGLHKPDGLDEINRKNFRLVYSGLKLTDLPWIKVKNTARLNSVGIYTVNDFCKAELWKLKAAFSSIISYYWYLRLRGYEIDDVEFGRRSYGNSYALPKPLVTCDELSPILSKLVTKMGARLRRAGYKASGVRVLLSFRDGTHWHKGESFEKALFDSCDIYKKAFRILCKSPALRGKKAVRELAVSCFNLLKSSALQLEMFSDVEKKKKLVTSIDKVNERWGDFVVTPAKMLSAKEDVPDRIAFGNVKELEEFTISMTST